MINIGVLGYGYWGPNIVRNLAEVADANLVKVADFKQERLDLARRRFPNIQTTTSAMEVIEDPSIDGVVIATPLATHFDLALAALRANKHVLVEKPMCGSSQEAEILIETAAARNRVLLVDHTFCYSGAVQKIRELIDSGETGEIYYYDAARINLGLFREDASVLWDLAIHDLSIMDYALRQYPTAVSCTGSCHVPNQPENVAFMTLFYNGSLIGHLHVNWLSPVKLRRTLIGGNRKMIVYDDLESNEKIRVHDKGVILGGQLEDIHQLRLKGYRSGDVWSPQVNLAEPLRTEMMHFVRCIEGKEKPLTDALSGLRIVSLIEAAAQSLKMKGVPVEVNPKYAATF
jgi:predicted dehydrogenase